MKAAFVVFDDLTLLDFVGVYDAFTRLKTMGFVKDFEWDIVAVTETVTDGMGVTLRPTQVRPDLSAYDHLIVPGGAGTRQLMHDAAFIAWLGGFNYDRGVAASVCSGALLLGAVGVLKDCRATTHRSVYDLLRPLCREVVDERVVDEGNILTARGVTSGIDLGLHLCARYAGAEAAAKIAAQMDYVPNLQQTVPLLAVADMTATLRFYVDGLGFAIARRWDDQGKLRWCRLERGGAALMLQEFAKEGHDSWRPEGKVGEGVTVYIICDDAPAIHRVAKSRGLAPTVPVVENGMWVTRLTDPDGYKLAFESATDAAEDTVFAG